MTDATSRSDVIGLLIADHRAAERTFVELEHMRPDDPARGPLTEHIVIELLRHSLTEEHHVYSAVRGLLGDGDSLADDDLQDHAAVEHMMKRLEAVDPASEAFSEIAATLFATIRKHIDDEEGDLFPKLRANCSPSMLESLGLDVERATLMAPMRPHPSAPSTPPTNRVLLAPGQALVDRARRAIAERPR